MSGPAVPTSIKAVAVPYRLLALMLAVLAFVAQNLALSGHIHAQADRQYLTHHHAVAVVAATSVDDADDGDDCPLCQAQQWAGQPLVPAEIAFLLVAAPCAVLFACETATRLGHTRSHDWHSRAPPFPA